MDDYNMGGSMRKHTMIPASDEDCPKRTAFLRELDIKKGRTPSNWRQVLGVKDPDSGQNHGQK